MTTSEAVPAQPVIGRVPVLVWILSVIFALRAVLVVGGSVLFAFPIGGTLGVALGVSLIVIGFAYAVIAWRMRLGERWVWIAAIVAPLINQGVLAAVDLSLYGAIPPGDYAFIVGTIIVLVLLFLPQVRRFFVR